MTKETLKYASLMTRQWFLVFEGINQTKCTVAITSGYYNPVHKGHISCFNAAKEIATRKSNGGQLFVIVNSDKQVKLKGSMPFMNEYERLFIVDSIKPVNYAFLSIDEDKTVCRTLDVLAEFLPDCNLIFCKGGDSTADNVPEQETCDRLGIGIVYNIGGEKVQSSSWLLNKLKKEEGNG